MAQGRSVKLNNELKISSQLISIQILVEVTDVASYSFICLFIELK